MKEKEGPSGAFRLCAYNASGEGHWVDLLSPENNREHTGVRAVFNQRRYYYNTNLMFFFYSMGMLRQMEMIINGESFHPLQFMSMYQFQDNILQIPYVENLTELKVFLPDGTYQVYVQGYPVEDVTRQAPFSLPPRMWARVYNNSNFKQTIDLVKKSGVPEDVQVTMGGIHGIKDFNQVKKLVLSSTNEHGRRLLFTDGKMETELLVRADTMQFQRYMLSADLSELVNILPAIKSCTVELQPFEETLFLFTG